MRSELRSPVLVALFCISVLLLSSTQLFAHPEGPGTPFSKQWLRKEAERLSLKPYRPPPDVLPPWLKKLDWDQYQSIRYRPERGLWKSQNLPFCIQFFHLGLYFHHPVGIREVVNGKAYPIRFSKALFTYGKGVNPPAHIGDLGFAGFRGFTRSDTKRDFFAFLGASYFRAVGASKQYGLSARGVAVDTGMNRPEEFPEFKTFWLERPAMDADTLTIHALLDGPSLTGAYTFAITPNQDGRTVMAIEAHLFPRRAIERIGIAPLTSMYLVGENDHRVDDDWRPEIHDSDGLELWTGSGEWIWRPLFNPPFVLVNSFMDQSPRGFGLLQRDRNFDHYQDDGAYYNKRPSGWVEPLGDWGRGAVQLVELPTSDETLDNIVAFWNPAEPVRPKVEMTFRYRLYWGAQPPVGSSAGDVIATYTGIGGIPGKKRIIKSHKFVIDFKGGQLGRLTLKDKVEPIITVSRGRIINPSARPLKEEGGWRVMFDLAAGGTAPVDLRCYLRGKNGALTETWLYQYIPPQ